MCIFCKRKLIIVVCCLCPRKVLNASVHFSYIHLKNVEHIIFWLTMLNIEIIAARKNLYIYVYLYTDVKLTYTSSSRIYVQKNSRSRGASTPADAHAYI